MSVSCIPITESGYPGNLVRGMFGKKWQKEKFSPFINPCRRSFLLFLNPNLKNLCFRGIFYIKSVKLIKNICVLLTFIQENSKNRGILMLK